ncbi:MAG: hypothetical protein HKL90_01010 [Elusimicrobia bacterium]|nr:hypothetical protein [Elusimicrobiota bacterium]
MTERMLLFARNGDFERSLGCVLDVAGVADHSAAKHAVRFDPLRHFQSGGSPDARLYLKLSKVLDSVGRASRRRAEYWGLKAAVELLFFRTRRALAAGERAVSLDPGWAWGFLWRARARGALLVSLRQARHRSSIFPLAPEFRAVLSDFAAAEILDAGNRDVYAWRSQFLNSLDQEEAGMKDLQRTLEIDPSYDWAYSLLGDTFSELQRGDEALKVCREMVERFSSSAWAYACRGRERGKAGLFQSACDDMKRAMRMDSRLSVLNAWIGETIRKRGDYAGALGWMDRTLRSQPGNYNALVWKARLLNAQWRVGEALACLRRAARGRKFFDEHFYLLRAEALLKSGRFARAAEDFDKAFPASPATLWSPTLKNGRRACAAGEKTALHEDMERLVETYPGNAWALAFRGATSSQGDQSRAADGLRDLDEAVRISPDHAWARSRRARARLKMGWKKEALQDMDLCLALKKEKATFWAWSGVLRLEVNDLERADYDFTRALRIGPGLGGFFSYRGRVRFLAGNYDDGLADLEEGFLRGPRTAQWLAWRREARSAASGGRMEDPCNSADVGAHYVGSRPSGGERAP